MLPLKTMTPLKSSKQTSAAASKIKNKILNTSSFFKVSLKTNNKALARALEAQTERSRQLQKEVVFYQKQVKALCFELAAKKYKHRKLLVILNALHSNTLQHLDLVAELFSDSDLPKLSEHNKPLPGDTDKETPVLGSLTDQLEPQTEISGDLLRPLPKLTADAPEKSICADVCDIQNGPRKSTDIFNDAEKMCLSHLSQAPQTGTSRPSSSLRDEVERLSMMFSQSGFDMNSLPCLHNGQTSSSAGSTCEKPEPSLSSDDVPLPGSSVTETRAEPGNERDKTVLLNTTMEMTLSNAAEIVAVETKAKKTACSGKPKRETKKVRACGSRAAENPQVKNSADSRSREVQGAPTVALLQTDGHDREAVTHPELIEPQSPKSQSRSDITSRIPIPKLSKSEAGKRQKMAKDKSKSCDRPKSKTESCDIAVPDLDDYFTDPENKLFKNSKGEKLSPENDAAEEAVSTITFRRSRTKGRRLSVARKTFVIPSPPAHESESSRSKLEQVPSEVEEDVQGKYETRKDQELPEELLFCADNASHPESEHVHDNPGHKTKTHSGGSQKSRCRGTFVVSVAGDGTSLSRASTEAAAAEQSFIPSTGSSNCEAEEPPTVTDAAVRHSESKRRGDGAAVKETPSFCKRPWLATLDSGDPQEDLRSSDDHRVLPLDQDCTSGPESQKPKRARREQTSQYSKKKASQRKERVDHLNDRKKKIKGSNNGFRSEDEACYVEDPSPPRSDPSPPRGDPSPPRGDPTPPRGDPSPPRSDPSPPRSDPSPPRSDPSPPRSDPSPPRSDPSPPRSDPSPPRSDPSPPRGVNHPQRRKKELLDDLQVTDLHFNMDEIYDFYDSKPNESKSRMAPNPKRSRKTSKLQTPSETRNPRDTFVVYRRKTRDNVPLNNTRTSSVFHSHSVDTGEEAVHQNLGDLLMDEMPPWLDLDVTEVDSLLASPRRETPGRAAVIEETAAVPTEASPAGRLFTPLTNTIITSTTSPTPDGETGGRSRRRKGVVSYKEPSINSKMRRGDKFTDSEFLSSPVFKDGKKKKKKKKQKTDSDLEKFNLLD